MWPPNKTELSLKQPLRVPAGQTELLFIYFIFFIVGDLYFCIYNTGPCPGGHGRDPQGFGNASSPEQENYEYFTARQVKGHALQAPRIHTHVHMGHQLYMNMDC